MTDNPFPVREVLSADERADNDLFVVANDISYPDALPETEHELLVAKAELALERALGTAFGHHEEIRRSMLDWAPTPSEQTDEGIDYRKWHFALGPDERNFGRLNGEPSEREKKAKTILAWAKDELGESFVEELTNTLEEQAQEAWREELAEAHDRFDLRRFKKNPAEEYSGWEKLEDTLKHVEVAYVAENHGTPSVAAVFQTEDGDLDAKEFTLDEWTKAGGDPQDAQWNRPVRLYSSDDDPWEDLQKHMETFTVEPLQTPLDDSKSSQSSMS